jgi:hypothetical protein
MTYFGSIRLNVTLSSSVSAMTVPIISLSSLAVLQLDAPVQSWHTTTPPRQASGFDQPHATESFRNSDVSLVKQIASSTWQRANALLQLESQGRSLHPRSSESVEKGGKAFDERSLSIGGRSGRSTTADDDNSDASYAPPAAGERSPSADTPATARTRTRDKRLILPSRRFTTAKHFQRRFTVRAVAKCLLWHAGCLVHPMAVRCRRPSLRDLNFVVDASVGIPWDSC